MSLATVLTDDTLRAMASNISYARGEAYWKEKRVTHYQDLGDRVMAAINDNGHYCAELSVVDGELETSCECSVGMNGGLCKHGVAVGLKWLQKNGPKPEKKPRSDATALRKYIGGLSKEELVKIVIQQTKRDADLLSSLSLASLQATEPKSKAAQYEALIDKTFKRNRFVSYGEMATYDRDGRRVINALRPLLAEEASLVIGLTERALREVEQTALQADDSDGYIGNLFYGLQALHLEACQIARPDPRALARRLFHWEWENPWDTFSDAAKNYQQVLGEEGLAVYRDLANAAWARIDDETDDGKAFHLEGIVKTLARLDGDLDALVAILSRNLSKGYQFIEVAKVYRDAGRLNEALDWAVRGRVIDPGNRLVEQFLIETYQMLGRHEDALDLHWASFYTQPSFAGYQALHTCASVLDVWPAWREKALQRFQEAFEERRRRNSGLSSLYTPDQSELVRVYLWENEVELAWETYRASGSNRDLENTLAKLRSETHPEDSLRVYRNRALRAIENGEYPLAVKDLELASAIFTRLQRHGEFSRLIAAIRGDNKRKRNLMALLDQTFPQT